MPERVSLPEGGGALLERAARALAAGLVIAWFLVIVSYNPRTPFTSRFECGSDPWDFLHIGETLDPRSLHFIVEAHCANARYSPDGWVELTYGGARFDVELRRIDIAGTPYFQVVSIGGVATP